MLSSSSDQHGQYDQSIQQNQIKLISVSLEKSEMHLFFLL